MAANLLLGGTKPTTTPLGGLGGAAAPPSALGAGTQKTNSAMEYLLGGTSKPAAAASSAPTPAAFAPTAAAPVAAAPPLVNPGGSALNALLGGSGPAAPPPPPAPTRPAVAATGAGGLLGVGGAPPASLSMPAKTGSTAADALLGIASGGAPTATAPVAAAKAPPFAGNTGSAAADLLGGGGGVPTSAAAPTAGGATAAGFLSGLAGGPMDGRPKTPTAAAGATEISLRFQVGDRVEVPYNNGWMAGTVYKRFTASEYAGVSQPAPYHVMLESGQTVMPPEDKDSSIRRIATKGAAGRRPGSGGAPKSPGGARAGVAGGVGESAAELLSRDERTRAYAGYLSGEMLNSYRGAGPGGNQDPYWRQSHLIKQMPSSAADAETAAAATAVGATPGKKLESMDEVLAALLGCVQALAESKAVTKEGVDNHTSIREAGGIPPLLMLLSASDTKPAVTDAAVAALGALAASTANHAQLAAGVVGGGSAVESVVKVLLARPSEAAAATAAHALAQLSRSAVSAAAVCYGGGVAAIVHILNISQKGASVVHPGALRGAVDALGQLAARHEEAAHVRDGHGAKALVALLKTTLAAAGDGGTEAQSKAYELATAIVSALCNLAAQPACAEDVCESGGVAALVALCIPRHPCAADAAAALCNLAATGVYASHVREAGGIAKLVFLCQGCTAEVAHKAAGALCNLACTDPESRAQIRDHGGIGALVKLLHNHRAASVAARAAAIYAMAAVAELAKEETAQEVIRNEMGFKPIGAMLAEVEREAGGLTDGTAYALDAVTELATNPHNRDELRSAGVLRPLVLILQLEGEEAVPTAAFALHKLAANAGNEGAIRKAGGIRPLVDLLVRRGEVLMSALGALYNLACTDELNRSAIREAGGIRHLVRLVRDFRDGSPLHNEVQERAAAALFNLAASPTNDEAMAEAIPFLLELCKPLRADGVDAAKSKDPKKAGAAKATVAKFAMAAESAAGALRNLACSPENQRRIREADGFAVLLKLLEAGHETPAAQHGAASLINLLYKNAVNQCDVLRTIAVAKRGTPAGFAHLDKTLLLVAEVRQREAHGHSEASGFFHPEMSNAEVEKYAREAQSVLKTKKAAPKAAGAAAKGGKGAAAAAGRGGRGKGNVPGRGGRK